MVSRIAVASRSRFDLLQQDEIEQSDSEDDGNGEVTSSARGSEINAQYVYGAAQVSQHVCHEPVTDLLVSSSEGISSKHHLWLLSRSNTTQGRSLAV